MSKKYKVSDVQWESSTKEEEVNAMEAKTKHRNHVGMHWITAAIFIVGDMMGGGMIALPVAVGQAGLIPGLILIVLGALFTGYTGLQLGKCWCMMQKRWPEYKDHCRRPYPEIAYRALGKWGKYLVAFCLCLTQFSIVTVLTLLASTNITNLLGVLFDVRFDFCFIILIIGLVVWPFTMLKSPMDFWQAAIFAAASSSIAAVLIIIGSMKDASACFPEAHYPKLTVESICLGYGTIAFAYGGHGAFPTIQHDMKKPFRFNRSVISSYIFILIVYIAVSTSGLLVYGDTLKDSIIPSMQTKWISQTVNILITIHILPTIIIVFSPLAQQVEEWAHVPHDFGLRRFLTRTALLAGSIFLAISVPHFGIFLDLVGGSTITLMTMLLPSIFWLFLTASSRKREERILNGELQPGDVDDDKAQFSDILRYISKPVIFFNIISLLFGAIGGVSASVSAIKELLTSDLSPPCYVQWIKYGFNHQDLGGGAVHCCGPFKNITVDQSLNPLEYCSL